MVASNNNAIPPGGKSLTLSDINRQNREFWNAESKKLLKRSLSKNTKHLVEKAAKEFAPDRYGIGTAHTMESIVSELIKKEFPDGVKLTKREEKIWGVIQQGLEGEPYCRGLHTAKVKTPMEWRKDGCPASYPSAYLEATSQRAMWRKRIQDEKHRVGTKAELSELVSE